MKSTVVSLQRVGKSYQFKSSKPTLMEHLFGFTHSNFIALKNVNLKIKKGERVGLLGPNGAGKTTLLRIIAGVTKQTVGKVSHFGKIVSLIEPEAGFHPDFTGRQNAFLSALILGMSKKETEQKIDQIIDFSGIGRFENSPLFSYSKGMVLRLAFSVAVHADPDILVLDEGIGVGDEEFIEKSERKIKEFHRQRKTIILATHWLDYMRDNCDRIIVLKDGQIIKDSGKEVVKWYKENFGHEA